MAKYQKFTSKSWADIMDEEDAKDDFLDDIVLDVMTSPSVESRIKEQNRALLSAVEEEVDSWLEGVVSSGLWMEEDPVTAELLGGHCSAGKDIHVLSHSCTCGHE